MYELRKGNPGKGSYIQVLFFSLIKIFIMGLVIAPIVEGKLEAWKRWTKDLKGVNKRDFDDFNKRYGLTRHDVWLVETPAGPMAVVLHEGSGGDSMMQK